MNTKKVVAINGDQASKLLLQGKQISLHETMTPCYELFTNGAPCMINKNNDITMLFGNSDAYRTLMEKLSPEVTWYYYEE